GTRVVDGGPGAPARERGGDAADAAAGTRARARECAAARQVIRTGSWPRRRHIGRRVCAVQDPNQAGCATPAPSMNTGESMATVAIVCIVAAVAIGVVRKVSYEQGVRDGKGLPKRNGAR